MIGTILSGVLGILFLTGAVTQYRCRGPIWSAEYFASSPKEKRRLRTRRAYYGSASACLLIGISLILLMIYNLTELTGLIYAVCVCAGLLFLLLVYGSVKAAGRSTDRRQDMVMHRENLDDVFPHEIEEEIRSRRRASRQKRALSQKMSAEEAPVGRTSSRTEGTRRVKTAGVKGRTNRKRD